MSLNNQEDFLVKDRAVYCKYGVAELVRIAQKADISPARESPRL